jgi:prepilin-type N-terminal cleavage/methylation domain-containing protein
MHINNHKINRAFTLIETLVAISILMIAIAGPLTVANKGFISSLDSKNQSIAINLAQEGLEYISYIKDNRDSAEWGSWVPGAEFSSSVNQKYSSCTINSKCTFSLIDNSGNQVFDSLPSGFSRTYHFSIMSETDQVLATVIVGWNTGLLDGSIELGQILTNYER